MTYTTHRLNKTRRARIISYFLTRSLNQCIQPVIMDGWKIRLVVDGPNRFPS
jgi:hypothetical protein